MSELGNGYKAIAVALALGGGGGSIATYTVASDYNKHFTALRVDQAKNECHLEQLRERLQEQR